MEKTNNSNKEPTMLERIAKVEELASSVFGGDHEAVEWLNTRSDYFFGYSPIQMILVGQDQAVIEVIQKSMGIMDSKAH